MGKRIGRRQFIKTSGAAAIGAVIAAKTAQQARAAKNNSDSDISTQFAKFMRDIGGSPGDAGGTVTFTGADPILYSRIRLGACMAIPAMAAAVGAAAIWKDRTGVGQDLSVDLREAVWNLNPFYKFFLRGEIARGDVRPDDPLVEQTNFIPTINGQLMQAPFFVGNPLSFQIFESKDGKPVTATGLYHHHMDNFLKLIKTPPETEAIRKAIKGWNAEDLEEASFKGGAIFGIHRSVEEWSKHPQGKYLATVPLIEIEKIGDTEPIPFKSEGDQPLSGIKALSLTHVIAGTTAARVLAEYGGEVLHIARPQSYEHEFFITDVNAGMRSTWLNIKTEKGQQDLDNLLSEADVVVQNMRHLDKYGFGPEQVAEKRPGSVYLSVNCYGFGGPWGNFGGFDMEACTVAGITATEGDEKNPKYPPTAIINDFVAGYIGASGVIAALRRRAQEGGSYHVKVSLTRCAMWYSSLGLFANVDHDLSHPDNQMITPRTIKGQTAYGEVQRLAPLVQLSKTPSRWRDPIVHVRGAARPVWGSQG